MIKKIDLQISLSLTVLFVSMQLVLSFVFSNEYFSVFGLVHYALLFSFILFFLWSRKLPVRQVYFLILIYQVFLVIGLFSFYTSYYENPLGFEPTDEIFYNQIGNDLKNKGFLSSIDYLGKYVDVADYGFPIVLNYIYALGGNEILLVKFFNIGFHLLSCFIVFRLSSILFIKKEISKLLLILYGLNPITVYFNASGRKEPLFILIVILAFYYVYKMLLQRKMKFYVLAFLFTLATGLFRSIFPVFIILSFGIYALLKLKGKYKNVIRFFYLIVGAILLCSALWLTKEDLLDHLSLDMRALASHRLGKIPSYLDYFALIVSGLIGPLPSFEYTAGNDSALLQTVANYIKVMLSFFFLIGTVEIIRGKESIYYPILVFISLNVVMLVVTAATFDHRFLFPFIPIYFIIVAEGFDKVKNNEKYLRKSPLYFLMTFVLILSYNLR